MKNFFTKILNAIKGNKLWVGMGLGGVAVTIWSQSNKAFYYGLLAILAAFRLMGSKIFGAKWTNYIVLALLGIFAWAFISEVVFKKETPQNAVTSFFTSVWTRLTNLFNKG